MPRIYYFHHNGAWRRNDVLGRELNLPQAQLHRRFIEINSSRARALPIHINSNHFRGLTITTGQLLDRFPRAISRNRILNTLNSGTTIRLLTNIFDSQDTYSYRQIGDAAYYRTYKCETAFPPVTYLAYSNMMTRVLERMVEDGIVPIPIPAQRRYVHIIIPYESLEAGIKEKRIVLPEGEDLRGTISFLRSRIRAMEFGSGMTDAEQRSDPLERGAEVDASYFKVVVSKPESGGVVNGVYGRRIDSFDWCFAVDCTHQSKTEALKDNDCFFRVIRAAIPLFKRRRTYNMRVESGIDHLDPINLDEAREIVEHYNIGLQVRDGDGEELLFVEGEPIVRMILHSGHYYWIQWGEDTELLRSRGRTLRADTRLRVNGGHSSHPLRKTLFNKKQPNMIRRYYDFETVPDADDSHFAKPYLVTWVDSVSECVELENGVFKYGEFRDLPGESYFFDDADFQCHDMFAEKLIEDSEHSFIQITDFNGSRFDQFMLLNALVRKGCEIKQTIFANNSFFFFQTCRGRVFPLDLCRIIPGSSLARACEDFNVPNAKLMLEDFSHSDIGRWYNEGVLQQNFAQLHPNGGTYREKIIAYGIRDVVALRDLTNIVEKALIEIMGEAGRLGYGLNTVGIKAKEFWLATLDPETRKQIPTGKQMFDDAVSFPSQDEGKFMREGLAAGRAEPMQGRNYFYSDPSDPLVVIDVKSLYPFVMENRPFPIGQPSSLSFSQVLDMVDELGWEKICEKPGFFRVRIIDQHLKLESGELRYGIIPQRKKDEDGIVKLKWQPTEAFVRVLNTEDIKSCRRFNIQIEPAEEEGEPFNAIVFPEFSDKVFSNFIPPLRRLKTLQDTYKKQKDPLYNPGLRQMYKILLNSLSGKVAQKFKEEQSCTIFNAREHQKFQDKYVVTDCRIINESMALISGTMRTEYAAEEEYRSLPHLAAYIYSHARAHMNSTYHRVDRCLYTDTDSITMRKSECDRLSCETPEIFGEEFGQYEIESFECNLNEGYIQDDSGEWIHHKFSDQLQIEKEAPITTAFFLQPKTYGLINERVDPQGRVVRRQLKSRFKGVRLNDKYVAGVLPAYAGNDERHQIIEELRDKPREEIDKYMLEHARFAVDSPAFFDRLHRGASTTIVCTQFQRHFRPDPQNKSGNSILGIRIKPMYKVLNTAHE